MIAPQWSYYFFISLEFMKRAFFIFFLILSIQYTFSQTARISGTVQNQSDASPLEDVHVFIPNTTFQAFTDSSGRFDLGPIPKGTWEIQARGIGWKKNIKTVNISPGKDLNFAILLQKSDQNTVSPAKLSKGKRNKLIGKVTKSLLEGNHDDLINILNPEQLKFQTLPDKSTLITPVGPIYFANENTGYLVSVYFDSLVLGQKERINKTVTYFELPKTLDHEESRKTNRLKAYQTSPAYFLSLLMEDKEGPFESSPNPEVSFSDQPGTYFLKFNTPLTITLPEGKSNLDYVNSKLEVRIDGTPVNENELLVSGFLAMQNPIHGVPIDWNGERLIRLKNLERNAKTLQESIFLHTDRRHYYPAENIYFKAYVNYAEPLMAEELSEVLHVELIDSTGYLWSHQVFQIRNGMSAGLISLPDLSETGNFIIRAYTALSLNYEEGEYILPIQILAHQKQPKSSKYEFDIHNIGIFSDQQFYEKNQNVKLNLMAIDEKGEPIPANLSVSVIDLNQAAYVKEPTKIQDQMIFSPTEKDAEEFDYPIEKGFMLEGQLFTDEGTKAVGSIQAFINGYEDRRKVNTNKEGQFFFPQTSFSGPFEINLQATDVYGRPIKTIELDVKNYPYDSSILSQNYPEVVARGLNMSSIIKPLPPVSQGEILLDQALVEEKKDDKLGPMLYGTPDNVIDTNGLIINGSTIQFLYTLAGRVAGMTIIGTPPNVSVRFRGGEPLVLINGSPANFISGGMIAGGASRSVYNVIEGINVMAIDRVEVIKRMVPQYGDQGSNGIISIFLKTGAELEKMANNYNLFQLEGFKSNVSFDIAEESRGNYPFLEPFKPTLYWNPFIVTDGTKLSVPFEFKLNSISGPFLVEIRGITELGKAVYGTFILNQKDPNLIDRGSQ